MNPPEGLVLPVNFYHLWIKRPKFLKKKVVIILLNAADERVRKLKFFEFWVR
jgi:hypothetical protein